MHDLVIRGGTVVDGTGRAGRTRRRRHRRRRHHRGRRRRRRRGRERASTPTACSSRPGFVDVHTHYDGQVTWDPLLTPSCWHGVTTVVHGQLRRRLRAGAPDRHDWLIELMEGVEDIPGTALHEGITWGWETFPEYLDALDAHAARARRRRAGAARRGARAT